jgi:hypothetical protein
MMLMFLKIYFNLLKHSALHRAQVNRGRGWWFPICSTAENGLARSSALGFLAGVWVLIGTDVVMVYAVENL